MEKLHEYGICNYDVISENKSKGRICLCFCNDNQYKTSSWLVAPENEMCLLKWNNKANEKNYKTLEKEMAIYECLKDADITPKMFSKNPYFVMKYESGCETFRKHLLEIHSKDEFEASLKSILNKYIIMLEMLNSQSELELVTLPSFPEQIKMFYSKLLFSGPEGTKENKIEKTINKIYNRLFWIIKKVKVCEYNKKNYIIHGDFHLNNELVNEKGNTFLIDFENVAYGNPNVELAYWYTQAWMLISMKEGYVQSLDKEITVVLKQDYFDEKTFWMVVELFKKAIVRNSRFQR